jgi:hypothetical protein
MKKSLFGSVILAVLGSACASDGAQHATNDDVATQVAFYGLTVMDCQHQASQCAQGHPGSGFLRTALGCSAQLSECLAKAGHELASDVLDETQEVTTCGTSGARCLSEADTLRTALACENEVETCVTGHVETLTGIPLPTSQEVIGEVTEHVGEVVETATEVAHEVADVVEDTADTVLDATHEVAEEVIETTADVAEHAVETTADVAEHALDTVETLATDAVDTTEHVAKTALQCGEQSRDCIRTTHKLLSCQLDYAECLSDAI